MIYSQKPAPCSRGLASAINPSMHCSWGIASDPPEPKHELLMAGLQPTQRRMMESSVWPGAYQQLLNLREALAAQGVERLEHAPARSAQLLHLNLPQSELPLQSHCKCESLTPVQLPVSTPSSACGSGPSQSRHPSRSSLTQIASPLRRLTWVQEHSLSISVSNAHRKSAATLAYPPRTPVDPNVEHAML